MKDNTTSNKIICQVCIKGFSEGDWCIQYEDCVGWFHATCVGIMEEKFTGIPREIFKNRQTDTTYALCTMQTILNGMAKPNLGSRLVKSHMLVWPLV